MTVAIATGREFGTRSGQNASNLVQVEGREHPDVGEGAIEFAVGSCRGMAEPGQCVCGRWSKHAVVSACGGDS